MENASYIALSRQAAYRREMDTIANNIANADTAGFKSDKMLFRQYLEKTNSREPLRFTERMAFVQDYGQMRDTTQGPLTYTGADFDLAIQGEGYFTVETPLGPRYTRNGRFQINAGGELVTATGLRVLDEQGAAITLPENTDQIRVFPDGLIEAKLIGTGVPVFQPVATIGTVTFENQQEMRATDRGLFTAAGEPIPSPDARIRQGMVEQSNVEPIMEITRMIEITRGFSNGNQILESEHDRLRRMLQTMGRTSA